MNKLTPPDSVYVVERAGSREVATMQLIELGDMHGNDISVVAGLAPGQRVVITGATLLIDGDVVRVIPE